MIWYFIVNYLTPGLRVLMRRCAERFSSIYSLLSGWICVCCCLLKVASSGRELVAASVSLIKRIWFLRCISRLLSLDARSSRVSLRSTCVQGCEGRLMLVLLERVSVCTVDLSRCCMSMWMYLCSLLLRVKRKWLVEMENSRRSSISINTSLSSPAPLQHGLSPSNLL